MKHAIALAAAVAVAVPTSVGARELKDVPDRLDPSKAYVLVQLGMLDETKLRGSIVLARYDAQNGDVLGHGRSQAAMEDKDRRLVHETASKGMIKDGERRLHLLELQPDLYVLEAANGTSFSLGSRTFRAEPGTVTDLGVITVATDWAEGEGPHEIGVKDIAGMMFFGAFAGPRQEPRPTFVTLRPRASADLDLPAVLAARARPVSWEADGVTFGNHLGGLVNRMGGRAERVAQTEAGAPTITPEALDNAE